MDVLDGLNPEQRRAAEAVRGPVCILAGAGSGKTTTITRRIANQVASGAFAPGQILAVTFTDKAAGELRERLQRLGVSGVRASTFHSAALAQLRHFAPESVGRIVASKAVTLRQIANSLPAPYKFRPAGDLATEIEWAKNRRIGPERYLAALGGHEPPIPADLMARVYRSYESRKAEQGATDFEDLLERTVQLYERDPAAREEFRARYAAFTVDEYQDVNLLQQSLLDLWLGERDDLCVVGDDYQSIYAFTGAGPEHLLGAPRRFPHAAVVRLEENYRSTPQVLALANRLVPRLGGAEKTLRATRPDGPEPEVRPFATVDDEDAWIVAAIRGLGCPLEEAAVLARTNARLADFEELFHEAGIPFQGASLLDRQAARQLLRRLDGGPAAEQVRRLALEAGWLEVVPDKLGDRELVRQTDLARLVRLAEGFDGSGTAFGEDLRARFSSGGAEARGVNLLTYHRAKGLEFDAVFLPRLEEKELPSKQARTDAEVDEERRLLYVGMTRARIHLALTWSRRPSRFLAELGVATRRPAAEKPVGDPLYESLRAWRRERAQADAVPAYVVFHDATLAEIAARRPQTIGELSQIAGVGPTKLDRYGDDVLAALAG
ncbi:MAG TPA: ATP-dependent DNA helicase UvrD2 [Gaiellaceae bacterium]|jgi:DNA helicase-2/ATP-dependent DNA helicase PcrA|nr:ATP-dependent DNA helicase UvrD2 [Gaiellaceae bacterium]